ncbi:MAG: chromosomal replication initiator protein DnaA [Patescibacteria group bacterium]|nr:chromosomal replication initiator protein DnaA [Patescibacteria group bacterium]MDD3939463.1 chromosomal replication initiator protein DnaA [Patescibacteria group bacterium]MDD4443514.1 chromosomal replication initiator protein DnaA [Patescibacteria group bacterium]
MNNEQIWQAVLGEIEVSLSRANFITWFKDTFISSFENSRVILCVPNAFVKKWLEEKYHKNIISALNSVTKQEIEEIIYKIELKNTKEETNKATKSGSSTKDNENILFKSEQKISVPENNSSFSANRYGLNSKYLFENFVVGRGNELAHAACLAVANNLGKSYNPLFIYGGVGLGKTHLMQAIGNEVAKKNSKILYTTSEKFTNSYIQAVTTGKAKEFKNLYRNVDLLLVDDIQFMGGKDGTQEEFFHTFNELQQNDKQIVLTSDRPPKSMPAIEKRLISRFESGMVADIGKPDTETKLVILEKKAQEKGFVLEKNVLIYIAENVKNNIRELEGALNKVIAYHQLKNIEPSTETVKEVLGDFISNIQSRSMSARDIIEVVAKFYNINTKDLTGNSRKKELVNPRQVAIYLIREELNSSYPAIGHELGGRDHTTAMHAYNKILNEIKVVSNEKLKQEINSIKQLFNQSY